MHDGAGSDAQHAGQCQETFADMMQRAGVTEQDLETRREIVTDFGQAISWNYLTWEQRHPVQNWRCHTTILYAGQDDMTGRETVEQFAAAHSAVLTVMENGEHWFHTSEHPAVLQAWETSAIKE